MPYDPNLPIPAATDIDERRPKDALAYWTCRYCGFREAGQLTTDAEARRCAAHEYRCPKRPASDTPHDHERAAYQAVHAAGLRRDVLVKSLLLNDKFTLLRRTWFFEFRTRRALRDDITEIQYLIAGIHVRARKLGLDPGWSEPHFRPAALR